MSTEANHQTVSVFKLVYQELGNSCWDILAVRNSTCRTGTAGCCFMKWPQSAMHTGSGGITCSCKAHCNRWTIGKWLYYICALQVSESLKAQVLGSNCHCIIWPRPVSEMGCPTLWLKWSVMAFPPLQALPAAQTHTAGWKLQIQTPQTDSDLHQKFWQWTWLTVIVVGITVVQFLSPISW